MRSLSPPMLRSTAQHFPFSLDAMPYDLRREPWIPFRRRSGRVEWGPPALLTDGIADDPVVALAAPRPDFDGALHEFLIGLLTVALGPADEVAWHARWDAPPTSSELQAALDALPNAFDLEGDGARFLQDASSADLADAPRSDIEQLLIEAPGDQTTKFNKDLFIKRGRVVQLGRPSAAMALLTMQTYAPGGGQGHRTSLRGGGPLTTLVDPRVAPDSTWREHEQPLWRLLWANVETQQQWARRVPGTPPVQLHHIFPWLAPTRVSDKTGAPVTPADAHPVQAYFGLPRRIRLEFNDAGGRCDLTGIDDARTVAGYRMRNYGVQYAAWQHPLTPHYQAASGEWLPLHGQPGGVGWKDWLGLTLLPKGEEKRRPAAVVSHALAPGGRAAAMGVRTLRVRAFGYDMDNMKARAWVGAVVPAFAVADDERARLLWDVASKLTGATDLVASLLLGTVERALYARPQDAPGDRSAVKAALWAATEAPFYAAMARVADPATDLDASRHLLTAFRDTLDQSAGAVFDRWCPAAGLAPEAMRRHVAARYGLVSALRGYGKMGEKLYTTLDVPRPDGAQMKGAPKSRTRKVAPA